MPYQAGGGDAPQHPHCGGPFVVLNERAEVEAYFFIMTSRHYNFELWTKGKRILHNMDLADALSAFLHLVFTFNLKYPQVCIHFDLNVKRSFQFCFFLKKAEYLCDFIQHVVAEYGDEDGTRTSKAKTTAENKRMRYYVQLGKALGMKNVRK